MFLYTLASSFVVNDTINTRDFSFRIIDTITIYDSLRSCDTYSFTMIRYSNMKLLMDMDSLGINDTFIIYGSLKLLRYTIAHRIIIISRLKL